MNPLQQLATEVLLGTERRPPSLPSLPGAGGALLQASCPPELAIETRVLRCAGVLAACGAAAFEPPLARQPEPVACPPETLKRLDDARLVAVLRQILDAGPEPLRAEALQLMGEAGYCLPPQWLPRALDLGQKSTTLRPALLPVLGQRGDWLASQSEAWSWALGGQDPSADPALWSHGTLEQRKHYLASLRRRDPAVARSLLEEGFGQLDARERAALLEQLLAELSAADEDFLEAQLADRSKEVRQLAARLLASLPASRFAARMGERLAACLSQERKLLSKVLKLEPPAQFGADWKADALDESRAKSEPLGERAWWLYQFARAVPLAWWPAHTGMTPAELIKWLPGTDWSEAVARAWGEALLRDGDADWAAAFLVAPAIKGFALDTFAVLACLPLAQREPHWLRLLESDKRRLAVGDLLARILQGLPLHAGFSARFAEVVLREVRAVVPSDTGKYDYCLRKALPEFVCLIPPASLAQAAEGWPMDQPAAAYFTETLAAVLAVVEQRRILHSTLTQRKPT